KLIIQAWKSYFEVLKKDLAHALGNISYTSDIWSDDAQRPYLTMTMHWIGQELDKGQLRLQSALVTFHCI
ncbi:hypothetical protein BU15DRAFT_25035, partial [Melanogaster broomeanus]